MTDNTKWSLKIKNHVRKGKIALKIVKSPLKFFNRLKTGKIASKVVKLP